MSDEHANQPPVDTHLPEGLAQCELMLAGMSLPRSRVQRDELVYRAGWAAAEVHANFPTRWDAAQEQSCRGTGRRSTFAWSLASAVVAASLAVAISLRLQPAADTPRAARVDFTHANGAAIGGDVIPSTHLATQVRERSIWGTRVRWNASLLMMRDRALLQQWDDPWVATTTSFDRLSSDDDTPSELKSSREMLQEFLPAASAHDTFDSDSKRRRLRSPWTPTA